MGGVLLADDAYAFMVAWETMALSSYFLVTSQHGLPEIRRAGFLYLLIAHIGDSRAYLFRKGKLHQLTRDHTLVRELYEAGKITQAQAATLAYIDVYWILAIGALIMFGMSFLLARNDPRAGGGEAAAA